MKLKCEKNLEKRDNFVSPTNPRLHMHMHCDLLTLYTKFAQWVDRYSCKGAKVPISGKFLSAKEHRQKNGNMWSQKFEPMVKVKIWQVDRAELLLNIFWGNYL